MPPRTLLIVCTTLLAACPDEDVDPRSGPDGGADVDAGPEEVGPDVTDATDATDPVDATDDLDASDTVRLDVEDVADGELGADADGSDASEVDTATPDPDVAPSAGGVVTDFAESIAFLFEPGGPQVGVAPGAIDLARVAVVRGRVFDVAGAPLAGVTVSVLGAGELGRTDTRADGGFDIALNGGGRVVIDYAKAGFLGVQRTIDAPWVDWALAPDVVMTPLDPVATVVSFGAASPLQVARGSLVSDADGARVATVIVPAGTSAELVMPDGARAPLASGTLRATEYTVGERGPAAMPGELPRTSAYTYALELSFDEALAAGASTVAFDQDVALVVDNFLDYPAGTVVPVGTYDRSAGLWRPDPDGLIVDLLGVDDGLALIDADGDGIADDEAELDVLGIDADERGALADLYPEGGSIWRTPLSHFSPKDCNWAFWLPDGAVWPVGLRASARAKKKRCGLFGSFIDCDAQTLGEQVAIAGTDLVLAYESSRTPGRLAERYARVPLTGDTLPPNGFLGVEVRATVAGQRIVERFAPTPRQVFEHTWDGLDAYGAVVHGPTTIDGVIAYLYQARSASSAGTGEGFGAPGAVVIGDGDFRSEREIELTAPFSVPLATLGPDARMHGIGGWTVDVHHVLDPVTGTVFLGTGDQYQIEGAVQHYAGAEGQGPASLEGLPVATTALHATELHVTPDGALHFLYRGVVYRVDDEGIARVALGCPPSANDCTAEDGALAARFGRPSFSSDPLTIQHYTIGFDGRIVFVAAAFNTRSVWEVTPAGRVRRVGGQLATGSAEPLEGALARESKVRAAEVAAGEDGSVLFTDLGGGDARQIWRISPSGRLTRVAGIPRAAADPAGCALSLGQLARDTCFKQIASFAPDRKGNIYVWSRYDFGDTPRIVRIRPDNRVETFAGPGPFACLPGTEEVDVRALCTDQPRALRIGPADVPFITTLVQPVDGSVQHALIRLGDTTRVIFGGGSSIGTGGPPTMFRNDSAGAASFALRPDGAFFVASAGGARILTVGEQHRTSDGRFVVVGGGARAAWIFDERGRHLATRDVLTGATLWTFGYDAEGRLASVADGYGRATVIERAGDGAPTAIVAPGGERTTLAIDDAGWLERIEGPSGDAVRATYDPSGLMRTWIDERGHEASFDWDELGRLTREVNRLGGELTLERVELDGGGHSVDATIGGETTRYVSERLGEIDQHAVIHPSGAVHAIRTSPDGRREVIGTDGTHGLVETAIDPRFPQPYAARIELTKGGVTEVRTIERTLTGGTGLFGSGVLEQTTTIGDRVWTLTLDGPSRSVSQTTPAGRVRTQTFDARGELVSLGRGPGLAPTEWSWSDDGRLESVTAGARAIALAYDDEGRLDVIDGPVRRLEVDLDAAGRPITLRDADGDAALAWSDDSAIAGWTLPGGQAHVLESNAHGGYTRYRPPGQAQAYERVYDAAGHLERIVLPSGRAQTLTGTDGRLDRVAWPEAVVTFAWPPDGSELPDAVTRTPADGAAGVAHTMTYLWRDGLAVDVSTTGAVAGRSQVTWGDDFAPVAQTYTSGADTVSHTIARDDDGLVVAYGPLAITRDGPDRATSTVTIGSATIAYTYDPHGDLATRTVRVAGQERYALTMSYASSGLPTTRAETASGVTRTFGYAYDAVGRLEAVTEDGDEVARYDYDARGNRVLSDGASATYDAQDRLQARGTVVYQFDVDGFLAARGSDTFDYSAAGELVSATVGGETTTWSYDAYRRVVRRDRAGGTLELHWADPFALSRPSAYRAPGEALTWLYYDDLGHLVAMTRGAATWIVASDQLGSPRLVLDASTGAVVKERRWDAFGRLLSDSAPAFELPVGFAGGIEDAAVGLVRFGLRDYEPASGRWTARDPILLAGGQLNLYAYVHSAPIGYRDPLGLYCVGASAYSGIGGGGKMCFDRTGLSVCSELGFGLGDNVDVNPTGSMDENFFGFTGGAKLGYGPASIGCEADYGVALDNVGTTACNVIEKPDCKGSFNGSKLSAAKMLDGDPSDAWSGDPLKLAPPEKSPVEKPFGWKKEGKLAVKGCQNVPWSLF